MGLLNSLVWNSAILYASHAGQGIGTVLSAKRYYAKYAMRRSCVTERLGQGHALVSGFMSVFSSS